MEDFLFDYNDIFFERATISMELQSLNIDALLDECNHILTQFPRNKELEGIFRTYFKTGKITQEDRRRAEAVYLLAYGDLAWEI